MQAAAVSLAKPRLRGVSHQFAFFASLVASGVLLAVSADSASAVAVGIYGGSLAFLYGVSALYHRRTWGPVGRMRMRSLDHAAIFVLIAGSYTPLFLLLVPRDYDGSPLFVVWVGAALGVIKSLVWPAAPKWITAAAAIAVGWAVVVHVARLAPVMGSFALWFLVASGLTYTAGGIVYALRRPDPLPRVFGYHEIFHALVIAGSALHFVHVVEVLARARS